MKYTLCARLTEDHLGKCHSAHQWSPDQLFQATPGRTQRLSLTPIDAIQDPELAHENGYAEHSAWPGRFLPSRSCNGEHNSDWIIRNENVGLGWIRGGVVGKHTPTSIRPPLNRFTIMNRVAEISLLTDENLLQGRRTHDSQWMGNN